jgi:hypothetical protein
MNKNVFFIHTCFIFKKKFLVLQARLENE